MSDMQEFNKGVMEEFRANAGKVESFGNVPMVILNTVGAKSGQVREIPLVVLPADERLFVIVSAGGAPNHPAWYYNVLAHPEIDVEQGGETFRARLTPLPDPERGERLEEQAAIMPQFADYVTNAAPRVIQVFEIERV